jgi:hypothetical protein
MRGSPCTPVSVDLKGPLGLAGSGGAASNYSLLPRPIWEAQRGVAVECKTLPRAIQVVTVPIMERYLIARLGQRCLVFLSSRPLILR